MLDYSFNEFVIIHLKFLKINQILLSHIPRNLKIFSMKPNRGIATFLGIQIAKNHIPRNLDARSNVDSPIPNATLGYWLTIYFRKNLTLLLCEMKKVVKTLIIFFSFPIKTFFNWILHQYLKVAFGTGESTLLLASRFLEM